MVRARLNAGPVRRTMPRGPRRILFKSGGTGLEPHAFETWRHVRSARCKMNSLLPTVLVVEDEFLIRMLVADELRSLGFTVIEAGSADEAVPILLSDAPVHVLITDVRMPGSMDGVELARRARRARPAIKVIMTSGHGPDVPRGAADAYLAKPFDVGEVIQLISRSLKEA
jgi:CheY-like chemotaxis protein